MKVGLEHYGALTLKKGAASAPSVMKALIRRHAGDLATYKQIIFQLTLRFAVAGYQKLQGALDNSENRRVLNELAFLLDRQTAKRAGKLVGDELALAAEATAEELRRRLKGVTQKKESSNFIKCEVDEQRKLRGKEWEETYSWKVKGKVKSSALPKLGLGLSEGIEHCWSLCEKRKKGWKLAVAEQVHDLVARLEVPEDELETFQEELVELAMLYAVVTKKVESARHFTTVFCLQEIGYRTACRMGKKPPFSDYKGKWVAEANGLLFFDAEEHKRVTCAVKAMGEAEKGEWDKKFWAERDKEKKWYDLEVTSFKKGGCGYLSGWRRLCDVVDHLLHKEGVFEEKHFVREAISHEDEEGNVHWEVRRKHRGWFDSIDWYSRPLKDQHRKLQKKKRKALFKNQLAQRKVLLEHKLQKAEAAVLGKTRDWDRYLRRFLRVAGEWRLAPAQLISEATKSLEALSKRGNQGVFWRLFFRSPVDKEIHRGALELLESDEALRDSCKMFIAHGLAYAEEEGDEMGLALFLFEFAYRIGVDLTEEIAGWLPRAKKGGERAALQLCRALHLSLNGERLEELYTAWVAYSIDSGHKMPATDAMRRHGRELICRLTASLDKKERKAIGVVVAHALGYEGGKVDLLSGVITSSEGRIEGISEDRFWEEEPHFIRLFGESPAVHYRLEGEWIIFDDPSVGRVRLLVDEDEDELLIRRQFTCEGKKRWFEFRQIAEEGGLSARTGCRL